MDLKIIDLNKLQDYAFTANEIAMSPMTSWNSKFINIKCLDNESIIPTVKAIPIPKGATNGDMIKAMFPNATIIINELGIMIHVKYNNHTCWVNYELDWWNAPYKGVEE